MSRLQCVLANLAALCEFIITKLLLVVGAHINILLCKLPYRRIRYDDMITNFYIRSAFHFIRVKNRLLTLAGVLLRCVVTMNHHITLV